MDENKPNKVTSEPYKTPRPKPLLHFKRSPGSSLATVFSEEARLAGTETKVLASFVISDSPQEPDPHVSLPRPPSTLPSDRDTRELAELPGERGEEKKEKNKTHEVNQSQVLYGAQMQLETF
ncbi:hypothetical protein QQF64_019917 [Cirrhinus molitorella]|uniref:Uncharacterized protein n=1 Tax=Cirrhinus molitorella TaxID=172907 RepID=A0ABR3LJ76_9TELE